MERPAYPALRLHLIGGLQTNKARSVARYAARPSGLVRTAY